MDCKNCTCQGDMVKCEKETCGVHNTWYATELRKRNAMLEKALIRAQEDINWMINERTFLNGFVFDYIDAAIKGE